MVYSARPYKKNLPEMPSVLTYVANSYNLIMFPSAYYREKKQEYIPSAMRYTTFHLQMEFLPA
jgi:hypothetical protein